MYIGNGLFRRALRSSVIRFFHYIENNGNANFFTNGEKLFVENLFSYFNNIPRKRVIFDVGANTGQYSEMLLSLAESKGCDITLHLFEPTISCYEDLVSRFKSNGASVKINNFGVSDHVERVDIYYDSEKSGLASVYKRNLDSHNIELSKSEKIDLKRLDEYIVNNDVKHIDFMKIDVEGHEVKSLEGLGSYLNSDFIDFIQFEYGGANLDSHSSLMDLYTMMESNGFIVFKIMPSGLQKREYMSYMESFQYSNFVAISNRVYQA